MEKILRQDRLCRQCETLFTIEPEDLEFYKKISPVFAGKKEMIPPPTLCPDCRQQLRLAFRNERNLYHRTCDLCRESIISIYSADKTFPVYCPTCWWGDGWDALSYGRDFDDNRPFFEQFGELWKSVPKIALIALPDNINSDYVHNSGHVKNCYLVFDGGYAENCYYGEIYAMTKDCCDFLCLTESELCYECVHCRNCYDVRYSRFSDNCSNAAFLLDCQGCRHCIACANLRQKRYCIFNEQHTPEEYERRKIAFRLDTHTGVALLNAKAETFFLRHPRRAVRGIMNENVSGDNLISCKDTFDSFDCMKMRDCRFFTNNIVGATDCYDIDAWGDHLSLAYNCAYVGEGVQNAIGCYYVGFGASNVFYCANCLAGSNNSLGCIGLRHNEHCILNKQYMKETYEKSAARIVRHMQHAGEWGAFFPTELSAFSYNETVAQDYFPLMKEDVLALGWQWRDEDDDAPDVAQALDASALPDSIRDISDDIFQSTFRCERSGHPFRMTKQELKFYRRLSIPLPRRNFDVRHRERLALRNPRKLWNRQCAKCHKPIATSYAPERPETVWCEECYLAAVY